jgi:response regulator RpfG family c-di-GMP phosphodiesterase
MEPQPPLERILYVDDEEINLFNFKQTFAGEYEVLTATDGNKALEILKKTGEIAVVITDQRMPGMSGFEVLQAVYELYPETVRMVITAYSDVDYLVNAINLGHVYRYIFKPWEEIELRTSVKQAVEFYLIRKKNTKLMSWLQKMNSELEQRVSERTNDLKTTNALLAMSNEELRLAHSQLKKQAKELEAKNRKLVENIYELTKTKEQINTIGKLLPICSYCKKIRNDQHYWEEVEQFMLRYNSELDFSHSICPCCYKNHVEPELAAFEKMMNGNKPKK